MIVADYSPPLHYTIFVNTILDFRLDKFSWPLLRKRIVYIYIYKNDGQHQSTTLTSGNAAKASTKTKRRSAFGPLTLESFFPSKRRKRRRRGETRKGGERLCWKERKIGIFTMAVTIELRENGKFKSADRRDEYGCRLGWGRRGQEKHGGERSLWCKSRDSTFSLLISRMCFFRRGVHRIEQGEGKEERERRRPLFPPLLTS